MPHADRLVALVLHLQTPEWRTAAQLAEYVGVSVRTIYRDVQVLASAGVPVEGTRGHGYRLRAGYVLPPLVLTQDEATALLAQAQAAPALPAAAAARAATAAQMKLRALLPASAAKQADALAEDYRARLFEEDSAAAVTPEEATWKRARTALREQRTLLLGADAEDVTRAALFEPYGLVERRGRWHVVGMARRADGGGAVEALPVRALGDATLTEVRYERPASYASALLPTSSDLAAHVVVRFAEEAVAVAREQPLPPGAEAAVWSDVHRDAAAPTRTLAFTLARPEEAVAWVLGFGSHAEVLAPDRLRDHLAREAKRLEERYRDPEPSLF